MNKSILDLIGNTPLLEIKKLNPNPKVRIFAKLEYLNPGGSIKDRAALFMIEAGEKSGELTPQKTVIEATSGNTGIGLALVCTIKGYKLLLAMSESASIERQKILKARGADLLLTPGHLGTDGAIEEVYRLARENPEVYFMADQFNNEANWKAHYHGTANEIWEQTSGTVTSIVCTMGTTGTVMGIARRMRELDPTVKIIGVEPYLGHKLQGLKNMKESYCPEIYEKNRLGKKVNIDDEDAFEMTRRLAKEEGLFVGMSSGAAMAVAAKQAETMSEGVIVCIFPDGGERYLSTPLFTVRDRIDLSLYNTMSHSKEILEPAVPGKVSMFTCGPTAHARLHPGEFRRFVFADLLRRYLEFRGYSVTHVVNITDFDDKTIEGAEKAGVALDAFTRHHIESFKTDLKTLGVRPAESYPKAGDHTEEMVRLAETLVKKGFAYEKLRSLYFNISKFPEYGRLSGIDIDKIRLGATVDLDEYEKDNPRDFTLLKRSRLSELKKGIYVKTVWGNVRPSWHIQGVAVSMKYLGENFDIYAGSRELLFPHNENERAVAMAMTGKPLARYWMHCDRVLIEGKKMNETDSPLTMDDLAEAGYTGRDLRYWLLLNHYRKPVAFSMERLDSAKQSLQRLNTFVKTLFDVENGGPNCLGLGDLDQLLYDIRQGFVGAMDDDLNISMAMASVFKSIRKINGLILENRLSSEAAMKIADVFRNINTVLNILDFEKTTVKDDEVCCLLKEREEARAQKDFQTADTIREKLIAKGVAVRDGKISDQ